MNLIQMKFFLTIVMLTALTSCESPSEANEPRIPVNIEQAVRSGAAREQYFGTPEGEAVVIPPGGVMTAAQAHSTRMAEVQVALPVASLALTDLAVNAPTWQAAHRRIQSYLTAPPDDVRALPASILEQSAAQAMLDYRPDLLASPDAGGARLDAIEFYLDLLLKNRYPNPEPVARMLDKVGSTWAPERVAGAAQRALDAESLHTQAISRVAETSECPDCVRRAAVTGDASKWEAARLRLGALAAERTAPR